MKYVAYAIAFIIAFFLFVPRTGSTEIRNLPILILLVSLILIALLIRLFKYAILMSKTKKLLKKHQMKPVKSRFFPWASRFHGRYSITFRHEDQTVQLVFLSRKKKYQRYHFERVDKLEFYRANRVVFNGTKIRGATISNQVEVDRVGRQSIKWDDTADIRIILFDRLPEHITDSVRTDALAVEDRICDSNVCIMDWDAFCNHLQS